MPPTEPQYFWRMNERWGSWLRDDGSVRGITRDYFAATLTGVISDRVENSVFTQGTQAEQLMQAKTQSAAANTAFMNRIASGNFDSTMGSDDRMLAQDVLNTTLALGAALGLEGSELSAWAMQAMGGIETMAKGRGYEFGAGALNFFNAEATSAFDVTSEDALKSFKDTQIGTAMSNIMSGGLLMTDDEVNERLSMAMNSGDAEGELEKLNVLLWSKEAQDAAANLHLLGETAVTVAQRLGLLLNDPTKLPSYATTGEYQLDPGQKESRSPATTAAPEVRMYNGAPFGPNNHPRMGPTS